MKNTVADFIRNLSRPPRGVYLILGEEAQLIEETRAAIRAAANLDNIERADVEALTDPDKPDAKIMQDRGAALFGGGTPTTHSRRQSKDRRIAAADNRSPPTTERRSGHERRRSGACFYEIIGHGKPSEPALGALQKLARRRTSADVLTIALYGLENKHLARDKNGYKTAWVRNLSALGNTVVTARLDTDGTAFWCKKWATEWNLSLSEDDVLWLAAHTEGNLSAAKQCLHKMRIGNGDGGGGTEEMATILSGGSRYNIFQLIDAALSGNGKQSIAILNVLLDIEEPPPLIVWAIGNAASGILAAKRGNYPPGLSRTAAEQARAVAAKTSESAILNVINRAAHADRIIKGIDLGDINIALTDAVAGLACLRRSVKIPTPLLQPE